jgi:hypothetical protein
MTTYQDDIELDGGSAEGPGDFELLPEGNFVLEITAIDPFPGTNFKTGEPEEQIKIEYRVAEHPDNGDWIGESVSEICGKVKNMANEKARLHHIWKAATGQTPKEGQRYPLRAGLVGKTLRADIVHHVNKQGKIWPRPKGVSPVNPTVPARGPRRGQQAPAQPADLDDELTEQGA